MGVLPEPAVLTSDWTLLHPAAAPPSDRRTLLRSPGVPEANVCVVLQEERSQSVVPVGQEWEDALPPPPPLPGSLIPPSPPLRLFLHLNPNGRVVLLQVWS